MDGERETSPAPPEPTLTAGQSFVKSIRPAGCALFLILAVLVAVICLTSGRNPIPGYAPPETTEYYAVYPAALIAELEENVLPALEYDISLSMTGDTVTVTIADADFVAGRAALLRYFDSSLLLFERG